ncbi:hypothetical protein Emag_000392 [Eimeria magna]
MGAPSPSFYRPSEVDGALHDKGGGRNEASGLPVSSPRPSRGAPEAVCSQGARSQPTTMRKRLLSRVERHRALLLALLLATALTARGVQLVFSGHRLRGVGEARADLAHRTETLDERRKYAASLRKDVAEAQGAAARKEGLLERLHEELREQEASLATDEVALMQKSKELAERRERLTQRKKASVALEDDKEGEGVIKQLRGRPEGIGATADPLKRAEAELAVFDLATAAMPREREKTLLVRELSETVKMRAAAAVLKALPAEPSNAEEARDVLRARRMLMSSAVRVQSTAWAGITRLLEVKGQLQIEQLLSHSPKMRFLKFFREEWAVQKEGQERLRATLEDLHKQLETCLAEQQALHLKALQLGSHASKEQVEEIELSLYSLENLEVSLRARKAQVTHAEGSGLLTKDAFMQQRTCRVEKARDNAAERKRRLPRQSDANLEVQLSLSALGRVLKELQDNFQEAKELSEELAGVDAKSDGMASSPSSE